MPCRSPFVTEPSSHISRKNAIIAVTKSAYAIFHAPPWWPAALFLMRLMTIGRWVESAMAGFRCGGACGLLLLHVLLELEEGWALGRVEDLPAELHRQRRRVAVQTRQQRHLDAFEHLARLPELL